MAMTNVYTGKNGTLTLADEKTPEGDQAKAVVDLYQVQTVGRLTGVEICVQTDLQEYHQVGQRYATSLHPGDVHIEGKVDRAYVNGTLLFLLLGKGAGATATKEPYALPTFNMTVSLNDPAVPDNTATLEVTGVKFKDWAFSLPEDDFVMENARFKALAVSVVDKIKTATQTPKFPK